MKWLKLFLVGVLSCACVHVAQAQLTYSLLTVTNAPVNGSSLTANGFTFYFTNGTPIGNRAVLITNTFGGDATNLFNVALLTLPQNGISMTNTSSNSFTMIGLGLTTSTNGNWCSLTNSVNTGSATNVLVPISAYPVGVRAPVESQLALDLDAYSTFAFLSGDTLLKNYSSTNGIFYGTVSNSPNVTIKGTNAAQIPFRLTLPASAATNGFELYSSTGTLLLAFDNVGDIVSGPSPYNGTSGFYSANGLIVISNINALGSIAGFQGMFTELTSQGFSAPGEYPCFYYGTNGNIFDILDIRKTVFNNPAASFDSNGLFFASNSVIGTAYIQNTVGTNTVTAVSILTRFNNTAMANGINAAVNTSTNTWVRLSGSSGAFTVNGIAGGQNDEIVYLENSTGFQITIAQDSGGDPTPANRIYNPGGADIVNTNNPGVFGFKYDSSVTHWKLFSINGIQAVGGSGTFSGTFTGVGTGLTGVSASGFSNYRANGIAFGNLATSVAVTFSTPFPPTVGTNYSVSFGFDATLGAAVTPGATSKTTNGFTATLSAGIAGGTFIDYSALPYQ